MFMLLFQLMGRSYTQTFPKFSGKLLERLVVYVVVKITQNDRLVYFKPVNGVGLVTFAWLTDESSIFYFQFAAGSATSVPL